LHCEFRCPQLGAKCVNVEGVQRTLSRIFLSLRSDARTAGYLALFVDVRRCCFHERSHRWQLCWQQLAQLLCPRQTTLDRNIYSRVYLKVWVSYDRPYRDQPLRAFYATVSFLVLLSPVSIRRTLLSLQLRCRPSKPVGCSRNVLISLCMAIVDAVRVRVEAAPCGSFAT
jgi:hypothetical protein